MNKNTTWELEDPPRSVEWGKGGLGTIYIEPKVMAVIRCLCKKIEDEWQVLLTGSVTKYGVYVNGYYVPTQEVTGSTVSNTEVVDKALIEKLGIVATIHSHSTMGVFTSSTDEEFTNTSHIKYHMVTNNKGDMIACGVVDLPFNQITYVPMSVATVEEHTDTVEGIERITKKTYGVGLGYYSRSRGASHYGGYGLPTYRDDWEAYDSQVAKDMRDNEPGLPSILDEEWSPHALCHMDGKTHNKPIVLREEE